MFEFFLSLAGVDQILSHFFGNVTPYLGDFFPLWIMLLLPQELSYGMSAIIAIYLLTNKGTRRSTDTSEFIAKERPSLRTSPGERFDGGYDWSTLLSGYVPPSLVLPISRPAYCWMLQHRLTMRLPYPTSAPFPEVS